jgi:outer membrane protein OmpA-like peptidoglycan-associated protein
MKTILTCIRKSFAVHVVLLTALLSGCAATAVKPPTEALNLERAVAHATDDIFAQAQERAGIFARMGNKTLVIDPLLDGGSGQQTVVMQEIEQQIGDRVRSNHTQWQILPFASGNVSQAQYLLVGTLSPTQQGGADRVLRLSLALTELKTGVIAAQSNVLVLDQGLDRNPTRYHRDSPIIVRDASTDAYARTAETKPGEKADAGYIGNVVTSALVSEATAAYNEERYDDALDLYTRAAASPGGDQLRVFSGLYLTSWKLGRADEAEKAFGNIVAFGVANNNLGLKILFRPRSTDFWPDPKVSGAYTLWLRQIARQVSASKMCLNLIGHASRTGSEQFNDKLSLQRAASIKQRLESESPALSPRMRFTGMGYRENLVGTGTDDVRDALDRRVEFKVMTCP